MKKIKLKSIKLKSIKLKSIKLNIKSLLVKMIIVFSLLIVIPLLIVGIVSVSSSSNLLIGQMKSNIISSTTQTTKYFDLMFKTVENFSIQLTNDTGVRHFYNKDLLDSSEETTNRTNIKNLMMNLTGTNRYLSGISIVRSDYDMIAVATDASDFSPTSMDKDALLQTDWYNILLQNKGLPIWLNNHDIGESQETNSQGAALAKLSPSASGDDKYDFILIDLNLDEIINHLKQIKIGVGDFTYAITPGGEVISPKGADEDKDIENSKLIKSIISNASSNAISNFEMKLNNEVHIVSYCKSDYSGWIFFTLVPKDEVTSKSMQLIWKIVVLGVVFLILAIIIEIMFSLNLNSSLTRLKVAMAKAEKGELLLNLKDKRKDEIGTVIKSFNSMIGNIKSLIIQSKEMMGKVNEVSLNLKNISDDSYSASTLIAQSVEEIANSTVEQTKELDNCVDATTALAEKINKVVDNTMNMQDASKEVEVLTNNGIGVIDNLNTKTYESNQIIGDVIKDISELNNSVKNIKSILDVLNGISEQTTLLSFNASIEAARAGEYGKGFTVVAEEIRKLADTSGVSTKEIQTIIEYIIHNVANLIQLAQKTETAMRNQTQIVNEAGELFSKINGTTKQLINDIQTITVLVSDIDGNKNQVVQSIQTMFTASEQNSASTQQVAGQTEAQLASIEELVNMGSELHLLSEKLTRSMEMFRAE